ncbi:MAG: hypothetical protein GY844_02265 [Bradyrhizobium sp.]|nr:hypothetical protein [Bradyrhizobium sp.]
MRFDWTVSKPEFLTIFVTSVMRAENQIDKATRTTAEATRGMGWNPESSNHIMRLPLFDDRNASSLEGQGMTMLSTVQQKVPPDRIADMNGL